MKVYTQQFACETPVQNRFYCPPNSMFKVGVKVLKGGEELSGVTLSSGGQALSADEDKYFGWTTWTIQSQGAGSREYVVGASGTEQKFKIQQVASDSTVFDMDATGGAVPADVATQGYVEDYVAGEISGLATQEEVDEKRGTLDVAYSVDAPDSGASQMGIQGWTWVVDGVGSFVFVNFHENTDAQGAFVNYIWYSDPGDFAVVTEDKQIFKLVDTSVPAGDPSAVIAQFQTADFGSDWTYDGITYAGHSTEMKLQLLNTELATVNYVNQVIGAAIQARV